LLLARAAFAGLALVQGVDVGDAHRPLVLRDQRRLDELLVAGALVLQVDAPEDDAPHFGPQVVAELVLLAPVVKQILFDDVVEQRVDVLVFEVLVGLGQAQDAVPGDLVEQGHVDPVRDADDLVGHYEVAQDDGFLAHPAADLPRELLDLHHGFLVLLERARVFVAVVRRAALGLAAVVRNPELARAGVEEHLEDLRLHGRAGVLPQVFAVARADPDADVALLGRQPFVGDHLLVQRDLLVLQEGHLVLHLQQLHLLEQVVFVRLRERRLQFHLLHVQNRRANYKQQQKQA